jgi:hypothetical protein
MTGHRDFTVEEVDREVQHMLSCTRDILSSVSELWNFADRDDDYHAYNLSSEISAVYHLVDRARQVLEDLGNSVLEEVDVEGEGYDA